MHLNNLIKLLIPILLLHYNSYGQLYVNNLMGLPTAQTLDEMNALTSGVQKGAIVYNLEDDNIYRFTGSKWKTNSAPKVYSGFFTIDHTQHNTTVDIDKLPFQPSNITFTAHANVEEFGINTDNGTANNDRGIRNSLGTMNGYARSDNGNIEQGVIYVGSHGNSVNDISRYSSNTQSIGVRYGDQNGLLLGTIEAKVTTFLTNGFSLSVTYSNGTVNSPNSNIALNVKPTDINNEGLLVFFTAYE